MPFVSLNYAWQGLIVVEFSKFLIKRVVGFVIVSAVVKLCWWCRGVWWAFDSLGDLFGYVCEIFGGCLYTFSNRSCVSSLSWQIWHFVAQSTAFCGLYIHLRAIQFAVIVTLPVVAYQLSVADWLNVWISNSNVHVVHAQKDVEFLLSWIRRSTSKLSAWQQ